MKGGEVFGTYYRIITLGKNDIIPEIEAVFKEVNDKMSVFQADSEINKLNELRANVDMQISPELALILQVSKDIYTQSEGAFDPSLGTLIELWGFGVKDFKEEPSQAQIEDALLDVGMNKLELRGNIARKTRDNLRINLSAIAKGYAVDRVAQVLEENGYRNFLVDIGGEVYAKGNASIWGEKWTIAIQDPSQKASGIIAFELDELAIATSGDYEKFIEKDGERYSHTINSKSGKPAKNKLASVSVFNKSAMLADAYATALLAMGEEKAVDFAKNNKIRAVFIIRDKDRFIIFEI